MVCDNTQRHICLMVLLIFCMRKLAHPVQKRFVGVNGKQGVNALNHHSQTLQPHARINILMLQLCIMAMSVIIKLGKYIVPYLNIAVAVAAHRTSGFSAAKGLASVVIYL